MTTDFSFLDLTLQDAEEELVGACIENQGALEMTLELLPLEPFRSPVAHELRRVFYVLAGWLALGAFDRETNRERLQRLMPDLAGYLDDTWAGGGLDCLCGAVPEYVEGLCLAIIEHNRRYDARLAAALAYQEGPLHTWGQTAAGPRGTLDLFSR